MNTSTGGRLFKANGDIWYSPNSQIPIAELPPPATQFSMDRNPFRPTSRLSDFHTPRWWTRAYGWTSFIPIVPDVHSAPFNRLSLARFPDVEFTPRGGILNHDVKEAWLRLENGLSLMVRILISKFAIPAVSPFLPSALGYARYHRPHREVFPSIRASSEWYGVWQGLVAFCIAWIRHEQETRAAIRLEVGRQGLYYPTWIEHLLEAGFDITWIEGFLCSTVFDFSGLTQRAGIFLDFGANRDGEQPTPDWFVAYNVPVWFNLKDAQQKYPNAGPTIFPQPHELQLFVSGPPPPAPSHRLSPSPPPPSETTVPTSSRRPEDIKQQSQSRGDEMRAFISRREEAIAEMMRTSSEVDRQRWADRRATPKTSKCRVVLWSADPRDPSRLVRELAEDTDILDEYTTAQKWYDPVHQTWHCCFDLAPHETTADAAQLINDYYGRDVVVPVEGSLLDVSTDGADEPSPVPHSTESSSHPASKG